MSEIHAMRFDFVATSEPPDCCPDCGAFDMTAIPGTATHYQCERCSARWQAEFGGFRRVGSLAAANGRAGDEGIRLRPPHVDQ